MDRGRSRNTVCKEFRCRCRWRHLGEINLEARHSPGDQTIGATHCRDHTKGGQRPKLGVVLIQEPGEESSINCNQHLKEAVLNLRPLESSVETPTERA